MRSFVCIFFCSTITVLDANGQGTGLEYLGIDGNWYYQSELVEFFKGGTPNPGSAKERTMLHAIETGKIQAGEAKLSGLRKELQEIFGMEVDISIIKQGGAFDNPPFIPFE